MARLTETNYELVKDLYNCICSTQSASLGAKWCHLVASLVKLKRFSLLKHVQCICVCVFQLEYKGPKNLPKMFISSVHFTERSFTLFVFSSDKFNTKAVLTVADVQRRPSHICDFFSHPFFGSLFLSCNCNRVFNLQKQLTKCSLQVHLSLIVHRTFSFLSFALKARSEQG